MSAKKQFKLKADEIVQLIPYMGGCIAPDTITIEGKKVKFMYRDVPRKELGSGWQFFSGTETQEYLDNVENSAMYEVNTIANYDPAIIPYLNLPVGTALERIDGTETFVIMDQTLFLKNKIYPGRL